MQLNGSRTLAVALVAIVLSATRAVFAAPVEGNPPPAPEQPRWKIEERPRVTVKYIGLPKAYAEAIATIAESTYEYFKTQYHLDMPDRLFVETTLDRDNLLGIWIADDETIKLTYRSERELQPPHRSDVDTIYGLTYRIADLGRERTLGPAPWLTEDAQHGLSHLLACNMIDQLYRDHGSRLWPDPYAYVETGWRQLREVIDHRNVPDIIRDSAQWHALEINFGATTIGDVLATWKRASIDLRHPETDLVNAIAGRTVDSQERAKLRNWFREFGDKCVWTEIRRRRHEKSFNSGRLSRDVKVLKYDDDTADGAKATPVGGHITTFQSPPDQWYLKEVQFQGKRYGEIPRSGKDFTITIYDERFKPIATWSKPYGLLRGKGTEWYRIHVPVTRLPEKFVVMLEFDSTKDVGVMLSADTSSKGHSATGDLKRGVTPVNNADWMIRVEVDRRKNDNPLTYRPD